MKKCCYLFFDEKFTQVELLMMHGMGHNETSLLTARCVSEQMRPTLLYPFAVTVQVWAPLAYFFVLYVIWRRCAKANYLMVPQYVFITSLSASDLLLAESLLPVYAMKYETFETCMSQLAVLEFIQVTCIITSLSSIVTLTINKYVFCKLSWKYSQIVTKTKAVIAVVAIWAISLLSTGLAVLLPIKTEPHAFIYPEILLSSTCFVGGFIVLVLHVHLHLISKKMLAAERRQIEYARNEDALGTLWKRNLKKTIIVNVVTISFMIFYMPQAIVFVYIHIAGNCGFHCQKAGIGAKILFYLSTMLNPIIYGLTIKDVRTAFMQQFYKTVGCFQETIVVNNSVCPGSKSSVSNETVETQL